MAEFELSLELKSRIIYAMENQKEAFFLDTATLDLIPEYVNEDGIDEESRFIRLPEWKSSDGFLLMEKFVGSIRNPMFREDLRNTLSFKKGVFRNFKDLLKQNPEMERLWFKFKEKEMNSLVSGWYNTWREFWGLSAIGPEPEEIDELVLSDFTIYSGAGQFNEKIIEYDRKAFSEIYNEYPAGLADYFYRSFRSKDDLEVPLPHKIFHAASPDGCLAAFIWAKIINFFPKPEDKLQRPSSSIDVLQLYVLPEYRGLGLAAMLLDQLTTYALDLEIDWVFFTISNSLKGFSSCLVQRGYRQKGELFELKLGGLAK